MHPFLNVAVKAARRAGQIINRAALELDNLQVARKGQSDYVTQIDRAAEDAIKEILLEAYPSHGILAEESGSTNADAEFQWIIDPLDGTTNFLHGIPHFAISIAVEDPTGAGGRPEITHAMVYQPLTDEGFWAEKGRGAWLQGQRLRVSARRDLSEAVVATGIPFLGHGDFAEWSRIFGAIAPEVAGIRRFGSAALDLAWVAAGRYDAFWESGLSPWDIAAGILLVKEAGGFVTDYRGQDRMFERRQLLAANDALQSKVHKLLAGALR